MIKYLVDEQGNFILTEDGDNIVLEDSEGFFESRAVEVRTPSGIHLTVPAGASISIAVQQYRNGDWIDLVNSLGEGDYYYTSYNIIRMKLTSLTAIAGVQLRVKWYIQTTHFRDTVIPELVTAVGID